MNKYSLFILFLFLLSTSIYSQEQQDVIFLNDGSIIKGNITEHSDDLIKIETCCGSIFAIQKNKVLSIEKETIPMKVHQVKQKGYLNFTSMGVLLGSPTNEKVAPFSVLSEHSYRINEYFAIGGLIGYESLDEALMPLGVNLKGYGIDNARNIFIGISSGYSFSLENPNREIYESTSGGPFFNCELGATIPASANISFFVAIGYRYNKLKYERNDWWLGEVDREVKYNRMSIRFGLALY